MLAITGMTTARSKAADRIVRFFSFAFLCFLATTEVGLVAEFEIVDWRGHQVLKMSGEIDSGTADKFLAKSGSVSALPHGLPVLLLDSSGGSVSEALAISGILGVRKFHTVVANGSRCASACASLVFIAGSQRTVEPFGLLGQHSCSKGGVPDQQCNELLAEHGYAHGVSHGSIAAFVTYTAPEDIIWFSREDADGWGLTRYAGEAESGFEKSEPRAIAMIVGRKPQAQSAWRIDFREDGYEAFLRPVSDDERELELNLFCIESFPGRLFLSMEVNGPTDAVREAAAAVTVETDKFSWTN